MSLQEDSPDAGPAGADMNRVEERNIRGVQESRDPKLHELMKDVAPEHVLDRIEENAK